MAAASDRLAIRLAVARSSRTTTPCARASRAVNTCSASARTAATVACARPSRATARRRFADPFCVRDTARCRWRTWRSRSRSAGDAGSCAMTWPAAVATTAAVFTPRSTPTTGPAGAVRCSAGTLACRSKFTVAYQPPVGVLRDGDVLQRGVAAAQQPPQLRLLRAGGGDADPPVLGQPHPAGLQRQAVADGEPGPVSMPGLEPREPPLASEERRVRVGGVAECVPERPRRVLTRPRCDVRLLRGPELCEGEERRWSHPIGTVDAIGRFGGPLVGVRLDLRHGPVERVPASARGTQQHAGLDAGHVQTHPDRTMRH